MIRSLILFVLFIFQINLSRSQCFKNKILCFGETLVMDERMRRAGITDTIIIDFIKNDEELRFIVHNSSFEKKYNKISKCRIDVDEKFNRSILNHCNINHIPDNLIIQFLLGDYSSVSMKGENILCITSRAHINVCN